MKTVWKDVLNSKNTADIFTREVNLSNIAIKLEWLNELLFLQNNDSEWP